MVGGRAGGAGLLFLSTHTAWVAVGEEVPMSKHEYWLSMHHRMFWETDGVRER